MKSEWLQKLCNELDLPTLKGLCKDAGLERHHCEIVLEHLAIKNGKTQEALEYSHRKDISKNKELIYKKIRSFLFTNPNYLPNSLLIDKFLN